MTSLAEKKEDVKKKIRSLLLSAPVGLTLEELERDYHMFIGCKLPSRELGYTSAEEYLMTIPDAVQVMRRNGTLVLKGVSSSLTQNIEKLVSKQKVDTRKNWGALGNKSSSFPRTGESFSRGRRWEPPTYPNSWERNTNTSYNQCMRPNVHHPRPQYSRECTSRSARHRNVPSVPAYVRDQIHKLLLSYPDGLPLAHFCSLFLKHYAVPLDHQSIGFSSTFDLLASVWDLVVLKQLKPGETWVIGAGSAANVGKEQSCMYNRSGGASKLLVENERWHTKAEASSGQAASKPSQSSSVHGNTSQPSSNTSQPSSNTSQPSSNKSQPSSNTSQPSSNNFSDLCTTSNIPPTVQDHIREIIAQRPSGVWASCLPAEYKSMFKQELPHKTYGYNNVIEFVSDLSHIVRAERPYPEGDWRLLPASAQQTAEIKPQKPGLETRAVSITIEEDIKEAVSQVVYMCPDGVPLDNFEQVYSEMTGQVLDIKRYGAGDLRQFLNSLPDLLSLTLTSSGDTVVKIRASARPQNLNRLKDQYQPTARLENQPSPVPCVPPEAVSPGCFYIPQQLPDFKGGPNYVELFVSNVLSPAVFWVQLIGRETTVALEHLMDQMESFYNSKQLPLPCPMSRGLAKEGMICAAIFPEDGLWHRAMITGLKEQLFEVYYVDYGNVSHVSLQQLRLLKRTFLELPAQAIQARLSNIKPVDRVWKSNSRNLLLSLCREKPLIGLVTDLKNGVLSLCLTDTTQDYDIHINDAFVQESYAVFEEDSPNFEAVKHSQAPSMELLYGNSWSSNYQRSKSVTSKPRRYIRQARMMDGIVMNLINLDRQLYLPSSEISSLVFERDELSAQLWKNNTDLPKLVVTRMKHADLFKELAVYGSPNFTKTTNVLSLVSLSALPLIIELYGGGGGLDEVKVTALEVLEWFDPDDPYWEGEDMSESEDTEARSSDRDSSDVPSLVDLQLVMHSLEAKKKRILSIIMKHSTSAPQYVNELNDTELNMKKVQALVTKLESTLAGNGHARSSDCSVPAKAVPVKVPKVSTPELLPLAASSPLKSTQRMAPMVQTSQAGHEPSSSSCLGLQSQAALDRTTLLQQHILLNSLMMEQLGISQQASTFQSSLASSLTVRSFGRGVRGPHNEQLSQPGNPATMFPHSFQNPLLSLGNHLLQPHLLQESQLLQQMTSLNASIAALGLNPLPVDRLTGLQSPAQGSVGGLLHNLNWMSTSGGTAPSGFSSHTPSLAYADSSTSNGLTTGTLRSGQQPQ